MLPSSTLHFVLAANTELLSYFGGFLPPLLEKTYLNSGAAFPGPCTLQTLNKFPEWTTARKACPGSSSSAPPGAYQNCSSAGPAPPPGDSYPLWCLRPSTLRTRARTRCLQGVQVKVAESYPTLCHPVDYTVHGILQARILKWVARSLLQGIFQPRDGTQVSLIAGGFFTSWATREAQQSVQTSS